MNDNYQTNKLLSKLPSQGSTFFCLVCSFPGAPSGNSEQFRLILLGGGGIHNCYMERRTKYGERDKDVLANARHADWISEKASSFPLYP